MIEVKGLNKYFGKNHILKDITESIDKDEKVVIIGPSGSGKSTFLRCLNLLEKPTSGDIKFFGESIVEKKININIVRQKLGMVFQQFNLFNNMTVMDNITLAPIQLKLKTKQQAEKKGIELLKRIGLDMYKDKYPSTLSGGQKQRIAIIRSLAMNPDMILFDEPTSALDPEMVLEVLELMKEVSNQGIGMVVVTHEMDFARDVATRILFMDNGRILEQNSPKDFFENPQNERLKTFLNRVI